VAFGIVARTSSRILASTVRRNSRADGAIAKAGYTRVNVVRAVKTRLV
jgi:hypothetical protein